MEEQPSNERETVMLRSELDELFRVHIGKLAIYQPDELEASADLVLGGTYQVSPGEHDVRGRVHIWQRLQPDRSNHYMIIMEHGIKRAWRRVTDTDVSEVWGKGESLSPSDIQQLSWRLGIVAAEWSLEDSEQAARIHMSPYEHSKFFTGR